MIDEFSIATDAMRLSNALVERNRNPLEAPRAARELPLSMSDRVSDYKSTSAELKSTNSSTQANGLFLKEKPESARGPVGADDGYLKVVRIG